MKIDPALRQHYYLDLDDQCYALGDFTSLKDWQCSRMNQLICNLKIQPIHRASSRWRHKRAAINEIAHTLGEVLHAKKLQQSTLVPIPPSTAKSDPLHDDRMIQLLGRLALHVAIDARELLIQSVSRRAFHHGNRISPLALAAHYCIDETLAYPTPRSILVLDDVLTSGCHFNAAKSVLRQRFPNIPVRGLFVAKRALRSPWAGLDAQPLRAPRQPTRHASLGLPVLS